MTSSPDARAWVQPAAAGARDRTRPGSPRRKTRTVVRDRRLRGWLRAALAGVIVAAAGSPGSTQAASTQALKAGFLYNFAKFAEWPADVLPARAPLVLCVVDDAGVAGALQKAAARRTVAGHPVIVKEIGADGPVRTCHLLYVDRLDEAGARALITQLAGAPVLSVGGLDGFARLGGVAHLFVEDGRMRFAVNVDAAQRNRLKLSSRLLSLALIVKDSCHGTGR
jgi:hypothetical protein